MALLCTGSPARMTAPDCKADRCGCKSWVAVWSTLARMPQLQTKLAPEAGLEPATRRLTAGCSTIELLWKPRRAQSTNRGVSSQTDSAPWGNVVQCGASVHCSHQASRRARVHESGRFGGFGAGLPTTEANHGRRHELVSALPNSSATAEMR